MLLIFQYILIYITNLSLLLCGTAKQGEAYELFLQGEYEILHNNFGKAEIHYSKALTLAPDSPTILQSLVDLKYYQGENTEAIQYLEQIMELEPNNKESGLTLYGLLITEREFERAESILDSLIVYYPRDQDILFSRANTQFSNQDWDPLLRTYRDIYLTDREQEDLIIKIYEIGIATENIELVHDILLELKRESDTSIILELLILIAESKGKYDEAIVFMKELIDESGSSDKLIIHLSELHLNAGQFEEVINILNPLYENNQYSLDILRMLLISYSMLGHSEKEISVGKTIVNGYPDLTVGYEALSFSYLQSGSNEKAMKVLLRALSKFPNNVTFPFTLATILSAQGDYQKAENYFRYALSIQPDHFSAQHSMALMYEEMDDTMRSDSLFLHMVQDNNNAVGQNDYAYILSEREGTSLKKLYYALELAENAIALEPGNAAFLDTLGWIYYKLGTYQKAEEYLQKSLSINDHNPVILEHLGDIYIKLNKSTEALEMYQKVLVINSENQLVKDKINRIYE